jgi:hypothetical protein
MAFVEFIANLAHNQEHRRDYARRLAGKCVVFNDRNNKMFVEKGLKLHAIVDMCLDSFSMLGI